MADFLDILARDSKMTCESGYYQANLREQKYKHEKISLKESIIKCKKNAIISEIKRASPSKGILRKELDVVNVASAMKRGGAIGISVLTEPKHFSGSLRDFMLVRESVPIPLLMKDVVVERPQVEAASRAGANAVLLIKTLFERKYTDCCLEDMIDYVHSQKMEVLLEAHTEKEFQDATNLDADLVGINNRDLKTLEVDLHKTEEILAKQRSGNAIIVSESGIESSTDVRFLRSIGARAFLVGTSIISANDVEGKVRDLMEA
jgi:indole-3-glycerol phosphate synthase